MERKARKGKTCERGLESEKEGRITGKGRITGIKSQLRRLEHTELGGSQAWGSAEWTWPPWGREEGLCCLMPFSAFVALSMN